MKEKLLALVKDLQTNKRLSSFDEAATKQAVILRVLNCLIWDTFNIDEVHPEFSVNTKRVDYSLRHNNVNKVFIEVKKVGEDLEKHQEQLLNYSFQEGVKLAILTNGITWWFYLPLSEGSWDQRKFYTIDMYDQDSEEITNRFIDFLSNENVVTGKSVEIAESNFKGKQKSNLIKETIPKAWHKLIEETSEPLIELVAETTEKICGHKPDAETVAQFLGNINLPRFNSLKGTPSVPVKTINDKVGVYTNKTIISFIFKGTRYNVRTWKEMLLKICEILYVNHKNEYDKVFSLTGRKKSHFAYSSEGFFASELIKGTNIYVNTNFSANDIVKRSEEVISLFGYDRNDLVIEAN